MREAYYDQLDRIIDELVTMTGKVQLSVIAATDSLLSVDLDVAARVVTGDVEVDALRERIEDEVFEIMALQQPVASDLRMLFAAMRMITDLERMGDLSVHIAKVAMLRAPASAVPADLRPVMERMAQVAAQMVGGAARVIADRDVEAAHILERNDEEMDELRRQQFRTMLGDGWSHGVEPAIDMALLGRYYERIADHAVSLARRVVYLVTGQTPTPLDA